MKRELILFTLVAVTAVGFVGCASNSADRDSHDRTTGQYIDDKVVQQRVKAALGDSDIYKFPDVKVETYQGTVQLTGFVESQEQKQKAEQLARNVRGVASVKNNILLKGDTERVRGTDGTNTNRTNGTSRNTDGTLRDNDNSRSTTTPNR